MLRFKSSLSAAATPAPTLTYQSSSVGTASGVTVSSTNMSIGSTAAPSGLKRYIVLSLGQFVGATLIRQLEKVTIDVGNGEETMHPLTEYDVEGSSADGNGIYILEASTGTTANVVAYGASGTSTNRDAGFALYSLLHPTGVPGFSKESFGGDSGATTASPYIDVTTFSDGVSVFLSSSVNRSLSSPTNYTESFDFDYRSTDFMAGGAVTIPAGGGVVNCSSTYDQSYTPDSVHMFAVSWDNSTRYNYEYDFGQPDLTVTSAFPRSISDSTSASGDILVAIDATISSTDDGILFELGGSAGNGFAAGVSNGTLRVRAGPATNDDNFGDAGHLHVETSISSYVGSYTTYYFAVDISANSLKVWAQPGGRYSTSQKVLLGSDTNATLTLVYGTAPKGIAGAEGAVADLGTAYEVNFNGSTSEFRFSLYGQNTTIDVSSF